MSFYVKPAIAKLLANEAGIPCVSMNNSRWYNISQADYDYLIKLVGRLEDLPFNSLTDKEKHKYSAMLHKAERIATCSVPHLKKRSVK